MSNENPYLAPKAAVQDFMVGGGSAAIAALDVSDTWKTKFYLVERAGGVKLTKFRVSKFGERMKLGFNFMAFWFGPIYYAVKGMWRKDLTLCALSIALVVGLALIFELVGLGALADPLGIGAAVIFATRANIDFYKKVVLDENGWG